MSEHKKEICDLLKKLINELDAGKEKIVDEKDFDKYSASFKSALSDLIEGANLILARFTAEFEDHKNLPRLQQDFLMKLAAYLTSTFMTTIHKNTTQSPSDINDIYVTNLKRILKKYEGRKDE